MTDKELESRMYGLAFNAAEIADEIIEKYSRVDSVVLEYALCAVFGDILSKEDAKMDECNFEAINRAIKYNTNKLRKEGK